MAGPHCLKAAIEKVTTLETQCSVASQLCSTAPSSRPQKEGRCSGVAEAFRMRKLKAWAEPGHAVCERAGSQAQGLNEIGRKVSTPKTVKSEIKLPCEMRKSRVILGQGRTVKSLTVRL